jgi:hypothetical protein
MRAIDNNKQRTVVLDDCCIEGHDDEWWSAWKICWQISFVIRWLVRNWPILQILKTWTSLISNEFYLKSQLWLQACQPRLYTSQPTSGDFF